MAMQHCDVLLAIGARFDDRVIGNPKHFNQEQRQIVHIDIDPSSISKRVKVDIPIVGDVREVLQEMNRQLAASRDRPDAEALKAWWAQIEDVEEAATASSTIATAPSSSRSSWSRSCTR